MPKKERGPMPWGISFARIARRSQRDRLTPARAALYLITLVLAISGAAVVGFDQGLVK